MAFSFKENQFCLLNLEEKEKMREKLFFLNKIKYFVVAARVVRVTAPENAAG